MKYFVNENKEVFAFEDDGSQDHLVTDGMRQIDEKELAELTKPSGAEVKVRRIIELKRLLAESDFRVLPDFMATKTQDQNDAIFAQRAAWRTELQVLLG